MEEKRRCALQTINLSKNDQHSFSWVKTAARRKVLTGLKPLARFLDRFSFATFAFSFRTLRIDEDR